MIDWIIAAWRELTSKEALTVTVSAFSFVLALASLGYTVFSKRRDAHIAARNELHSCISKISEIRAKKDDKRLELGDEFLSNKHTAMRVILNDTIKLYLSKAILLITRYRGLDISSFENVLLAAALADEGKFKHSLKFYRRAVKTSADKADKATALRVYGRALIAAGYPRWGRSRMLKAAKLFFTLSETHGYDDSVMNYERADTYSRLIATQLRWNYPKNLSIDLAAFKESIGRIGDDRRCKTMEELLDNYSRAIAGTNPAATENRDASHASTPGSA
jgi:hypothetical protein